MTNRVEVDSHPATKLQEAIKKTVIFKEKTSTTSEITVIKLQGEPYQTKNMDCTQTLERLAQNSRYKENLEQNVQDSEHLLEPLFQGGFYGIDAKLKKGQDLNFQESFSLMTFVSMGVNKAVHEQLSGRIKVGATDPDTILYQSIALLSAMSAKEGFVGLTPEEIAGLTAATLRIDTIVRVPASGPVIGIGGMGGDRGYPTNGESSKLFSISTLSAINLANFGFVHKHHSYPNTSRVAGQSAIEAFGARSDQDTLEQFLKIQKKTSLLMSSCHTTRLIHTLSHRLKGETINHVVGPLAIPVSADTPVHAFIGVNDNVHPEDIIKTLKIIQSHGVQQYQNSVAFCGLNTINPNPDVLNPNIYYRQQRLKQLVAIDEVAPPPYPTMASFLINGENIGTFIIKPENFLEPEFLDQIDFSTLFIPNTTESILLANQSVINGTDLSKCIYVAMTTALGIFTKEYSHLPEAFDHKNRQINSNMLQEAFVKAFKSIAKGEIKTKLDNYVVATQQSI